jgi:hypothetical protein
VGGTAGTSTTTNSAAVPGGASNTR